MKICSLVFLCFLLGNFSASAQQPCATFECSMQRAKTAFDAGKYREAYEELKSARHFEHADQVEINIWLDKTFDALETQHNTDAKTWAGVQKHLYLYQGRFGLAYDRVNERFGFMDPSGHILIPMRFRSLTPFDAEGFARGQKAEGSDWRSEYLVDTLGNTYKLATEIAQLDSTITALDLRDRSLAELPEVVCKYTQLQVLLLGKNRLSALPDRFGDLKNLKILYLNNNLLTKLPENFSSMTALQTLMLDGNKLAALPDDFGNLKNLEDLSLYNNQITRIPPGFGSLNNLRRLHLSVNPIGTLPESFGKLNNLEFLTLIECNLQRLPESFGQLSKLRWLEANVNHLTGLPESFGQLKMLRNLVLNMNELKGLPASFGQLSKLETFAAFANQMTALPADFGNMTYLRELALGQNRITHLPENFSQLTHLESFEISKNQLSQLPKGLGRLRNLKRLDVSENQLENLPAELGVLDSLQELYINDNQLGSLPEEIGQLGALTTLFAGGNKLSTLPSSLCNLIRLETFSYLKNPILELPPCIKNMSAQAPAFEALLYELDSESSDSALLLAAQKMLKNSYQQAYKNALNGIRSDSSNAGLYFSLSYYALFESQYSQAIAAAQKTLQLNPRLVKVETNLALGYLLNNQYNLALPIYLKWKGKKFEADDLELADEVFLKDIRELEDMGILHPGFRKVKDLFSK